MLSMNNGGDVVHDGRMGELSRLSRRERDVLRLAASGLTNAQIAVQLGVSTHAIKFHLAGTYRKLGVVNRTEAAAHYARATAELSLTEG
jgi:DNA-binding CsgD family transcriptional regulator